MGKANEIINFFKGIKNFSKKTNGLTYTLKHVLDLYDKKKIDEDTFKTLFRDVYVSGLNISGDSSFIFDQKGLEGGLGVSINLMPYLEGLVGLTPEAKITGQVLKQRVLSLVRQNNVVESTSPYTYGVINMEGIYTKISGGIGIQLSIGYTKSAASVLDSLEFGTIALGASAGVSGNAEGYFLAVDTENPQYFNSVTDREMKVASSMISSIKTPIPNALPRKSETNSLRLWSTSALARGEVGASAGIDCTSLIATSLGGNAASGIEASLSHKKYRLITTNSDNVCQIQDTEMTIKKAGAMVELTVGDVNFLSNGLTTGRDPLFKKGRDFVFINSLSYEGSLVRIPKGSKNIIQNESAYVIGQSVSVQSWRQYFQEGYLQYRKTPDESPYLATLSAKLHVSPAVLSGFLIESATILNDTLHTLEGEDILSTAFFIEAQFAPAVRTVSMEDSGDALRKSIKGTLSESRFLSLNLRYRIADNLTNTTALAFGFGVGKSRFNVGLGIFEDSSSLEVVNLYTSSSSIYNYSPFAILTTI